MLPTISSGYAIWQAYQGRSTGKALKALRFLSYFTTARPMGRGVVVNLQNIALENVPGALVQDTGSLPHGFRVHAAVFAHNVFAGADNTDSLAVNVQVPAGPFTTFQLPTEKNPARQLPGFRLAAFFGC
mgnify:CR=1 FL=1